MDGSLVVEKMLMTGDIEDDFHRLGIAHMCFHRNFVIAKQNISIIIIIVLFNELPLKESIRSRGSLHSRSVPQCHSLFHSPFFSFLNGKAFFWYFLLRFSPILPAFFSWNPWVFGFQFVIIFGYFCFDYVTFLVTFGSHSFQQVKSWFDVLKNQSKTVGSLWRNPWLYFLTIILQPLFTIFTNLFYISLSNSRFPLQDR